MFDHCTTDSAEKRAGSAQVRAPAYGADGRRDGVDGDVRGLAEGCRAAMAELVAALDPGALLASETPELWGVLDQIERLAAAGKVLVARRVDESRVWEREGLASAVDYLARRSGETQQAARNALATSKRLPKLAGVEEALRRGELSVAQVHPIADAASEDPSAESRLLDAAHRSSLRELRQECLRVKAAADPDPEAKHRRLHKDRFFRQSTDDEGAWVFWGRGTPENAGVLKATLDPIINDVFREAWREGRREGREQYAFDAFMEMTRRAHSATYGDPDDGRTGGGNDNAPDNSTHASSGVRSRGAGTGTGGSGSRDPDDVMPEAGRDVAEGDRSGRDAAPPGSSDQGRQSDDDMDWSDDSGGSAGTDRDDDAGDPGGSRRADSGDVAGRSEGNEGAGRGGSETGGELFPESDRSSVDGKPGQVREGAEPTRTRQRGRGRRARRKRRRQQDLSQLAILRVDLEALQRGHVLPDEVCEVVETGPVPPASARRLLDDSVVKLVVTLGDEAVTVTHVGHGSAAVQRLFSWRQPRSAPEAQLAAETQPPVRPPTYLALVHVDGEALVRRGAGRSGPGGAGVDGNRSGGEERCVVPGVGAVSTSAARELLGPSLLDRVCRKGVAVARIVHRGRKPTVAQRCALWWTQPDSSIAP